MVAMAASGAVEPGPPGAAVAPSPALAPPPAPDHLFRPISAEDEEQQPTEIESLCMNCYCNVRRGGRAWAGTSRGLDPARWALLGTPRRTRR